MSAENTAKRCKDHTDRKAVAFCVKCGAPLCEKCYVTVERRPHCGACGSVYRAEAQRAKRRVNFSLMAENIQISVTGTVRNKELRRLCALLLDGALVLILSAPASLALQLLGTRFLVPDIGGLSFFLCLYAGIFLVASIYFIYFPWKGGKTPGKQLMGLKVRFVGGNKLTFFASVWRWVGMLTAAIWMYVGFMLADLVLKLLSSIASRLPLAFMMFFWLAGVMIAVCCSLGILIAFVGRHKRGFHDILAGSIVVSDSYFERGAGRG